MSDIMTVQEVFAYTQQLIIEGATLPEGYSLEVRIPPGFGPPGDLIVTVRALAPGGGIAFATTIASPPHTAESINDVIADRVTAVRRRLASRSN